MFGGSARSIRRYSLELWQDLVLHGIRKFPFQHLTVNWNLNVLEMALKALNFVQGLSRTPLLFFLDISPTYFPNYFAKNNNFDNDKSEHLKIPKPRFTNRSPVFFLV